MKQPQPPKKGHAAYEDDFKVRKVEGGYLVVVEVSEIVEDSSSMEGVEPGLRTAFASIVPASQRATMNKVTHERTIVAKSTAEIVAHLREWTGDVPVPA